MKYEIKKEKGLTGQFTPFSLKLFFETKEEYVNFHDNAMCKITGVGFHKFHGDVYDAGRIQKESKGEI